MKSLHRFHAGHAQQPHGGGRFDDAEYGDTTNTNALPCVLAFDYILPRRPGENIKYANDCEDDWRLAVSKEIRLNVDPKLLEAYLKSLEIGTEEWEDEYKKDEDPEQEK